MSATRESKYSRFVFVTALACLLGAMITTAGCGGGSNAPATTTTSGGGGTGGSGGSGGGGGTGSNVLAITVNSGPAVNPPIDEAFINGAFTSVTVCSPGSTTNCQTVGGILVDTGSSGLRILSSALTISLPQQTAGSNSVVECLPFIDSTTWGPVETADVTIASEAAHSVPLQVIGTDKFSSIPTACTNQGPAQEDLADLGANGLLGVGNFQQDCGEACTVSGGGNPGLYYACTSSGACSVTTESLANQVQNPVGMFATDNNGVVIQLPSVTGSEASVSGTMTFGIGTQSNNALGSATVFTIDPNSGDFTTTFKGQAISEAFLDTGSNAIYFLSSAQVGAPVCADATFWYCPSSTLNLSAVTQGTNGATQTINFTVGNADTLTATVTNAAVQGLAGPGGVPGVSLFDWGLPFFYGRTVFVAIEGKSTPGGNGPFWAY